jgi:hypothetical protein
MAIKVGDMSPWGKVGRVDQLGEDSWFVGVNWDQAAEPNREKKAYSTARSEKLWLENCRWLLVGLLCPHDWLAGERENRAKTFATGFEGIHIPFVGTSYPSKLPLDEWPTTLPFPYYVCVYRPVHSLERAPAIDLQ